MAIQRKSGSTTMRTEDNRTLGGSVERMALAELSKRGWWCHLMAQGAQGQPCDIVALKDGKGMLLDAKRCQGTRFPLSRVEPNQRACFLLAESRGNRELGLIVWFEPLQQFRLISWQAIKEANKAGRASISAEEASPL